MQFVKHGVAPPETPKMASNPPNCTNPYPSFGADSFNQANPNTKSSTNQLSETLQGGVMGIAARRPDLKNKADTLFEKKVKAEYDQIAAMKEQLQKNKKILAVDEAHLKLVNGWRYLGETRAGSRVGLLEEALQYRGALKVCGSHYSFLPLEA